jgi:hypothetical protein
MTTMTVITSFGESMAADSKRRRAFRIEHHPSVAGNLVRFIPSLSQ